jgi:hypothetical protein
LNLVATTAPHWGTVAAPVMVDINADGYLDLPSIGFVNTLPKESTSSTLIIRLLSRSGAPSEHGTKITIWQRSVHDTSTNAKLVAARVVDTGGSSNSQQPYDVLVGVPSVAGVEFDAAVRFSSGRLHNASEQAFRSLNVNTVVILQVL